MVRQSKSFAYQLREMWPYFCLLAVVWVLYGSAVSLWWVWDDTQILKNAVKYHPWQYFFFPEVWREYNANNFTPLLLFSFDIDVALFGLNPRMFYVHHLIALWLCSVGLCIVLRLWLTKAHAFIGSLLFLISLQSAVLSQQLMVRHYLEGLILSLASLWFYVQGVRQNKKWFDLLSALAYLGAVSAKEVYVPLVFLCLALPEKDWKTRLLRALPLLGVFLLYLPWRWWMLGGSIGGYSDPSILKSLSSLLQFGKQVFTSLFGGGAVYGHVISSIVLTLSVIFLATRLRTLAFCVWAGLLTVSPLLTIPFHLFSDRHVFVLWVMVSALSAAASQYYWSLKPSWRILSIVFIAALSIGTFLHSRPTWAENLDISRRMGIEGRFFLQEAKDDDILRMPVGQPWYYEGLNWLRRNVYDSRINPQWYADDIYLCETGLKGKRFWSYSSDGKSMRNITELIPDIQKEYCGKVRSNAAVHIRVKYSKSQLSWTFGPYREGTYSFLLGSTGRVDVPSSGVLNVRLQGDNEFRVRYESPDGWVAYSPVLVLSVREEHGGVHWGNSNTKDL